MRYDYSCFDGVGCIGVKGWQAILKMIICVFGGMSGNTGNSEYDSLCLDGVHVIAKRVELSRGKP